MGSVRVHAPIIDTMFGWDPIRFIKFISASRSSLYDIGAQSEKKIIMIILNDGNAS